MKKILALCLMVLSFQSFAGEVVLLDTPTWKLRNFSKIRKDFEVNRDLARAWVTLNFVPRHDDDSVEEAQRVKVPGLSYDVDAKEVVLEVDGARIVCATVKNTFLGPNIKETKNCKFSEKHYTVLHDDGFEIKKINKVKVSLNY